MKLLLFVLIGCTSERVVRPLTIAHVDVTYPDCPESCYSPLGFWDICSGNFAFIEPDATHIDADTPVDADDLAQLVQLQYGGAVRNNGRARPHLDFTLTAGDVADVAAAYAPELVLYRIDARGGVIDVDYDHLAAADSRTLEFRYDTVGERHVIDKPRMVAVDVSESYFCCSSGRGGSLWLVALLFVLVRRRRY